MPPKVAFCLCLLFIFWLFAKSKKQARGLSGALWIPLIWALLIGSKPITLWLGLTGTAETADSYVEGSPVDRLLFLALIIAGLFVINRRHTTWRNIIANNKWLFLFFLYLGFSAVWSDYPFVSFKRWIKDFGNVIMVLVVLGELEPVTAIQTLLARCSYVLIPFSVVFIKYFPEIGRYYDRWTWTPHYGGVTTDKNQLGMTVFVCGLFLCSRFPEMYREWKTGERTRADFFAYVILLLMVFWLLSIAESSTALTCLLIGISLFLALKLPGVRLYVGRMGISLAAAVVLVLVLAHFFFNLGEFITGALGRNMTLTGRTQIWTRVLNEDINPLLGTGFYSFWLGNRPDKLSENYAFHLNEAHNGFLETYLNSGIVGVFLLLAVLASSMKRIQRRLLVSDSEILALQLSFLLSIVLYNVTESAFNRLDIVWVALLLFIIEYPQARNDGADKSREEVWQMSSDYLRMPETVSSRQAFAVERTPPS